MKKTWTEKEAFELIEKVEAEFMAHLTAGNQPLEKSEAKTEEVKAEGSAPMEKTEVKETEVKAIEVKSTEGEAELSKNEACEYNDEDVEEMNKLYKSMADSERKAHYSALKKAMVSDEMEKSEKQETATPEVIKENDEVTLLKAELDAVKAANSELKKNFEGVIEALKARFVKKPAAPKQKAITELGVLAKTEGKEDAELSREQVIKKLGEKAKDPSLKKSDRDLINAYCYNKVNVTAIKHLITSN